jgi:tRNA-uridine 2-sulfurtransferase
VRVVLDQGIEVLAVAFASPFFGPEKAREMARQLGVPLRVVDFTVPHLAMVKAPPHGYGRNMNPCIDCHAMMVAHAGALMGETGARFLFTGEVLNQRPMSQNLQSLHRVERLSGMEGALLRPLSARLLPETPMEKEGVVDRSRLLDLSGRSRRRQIELAERWGIRDYPAPAGGCLLTDPGFSARLRDLFGSDPAAGPEQIERLRHGRHFRLPGPRSGGVRAIVGRNQADNEALARLSTPADRLLSLARGAGPLTLLEPPFSDDVLLLAASLTLAHSRARPAPEGGAGVEAEVAVRPGGGEWEEGTPFLRVLHAVPLSRSGLEKLRIG